MGIVEELGSGTRKIFKYTPLMSGGKLPQIEEEDVYKVTIPIEVLASDGGQKSIQKTPKIILSLISNNPYVTKNEMASTLNLSVPTISKQLARLKKGGDYPQRWTRQRWSLGDT